MCDSHAPGMYGNGRKLPNEKQKQEMPDTTKTDAKTPMMDAIYRATSYDP